MVDKRAHKFGLRGPVFYGFGELVVHYLLGKTEGAESEGGEQQAHGGYDPTLA
jgi:hypothetical protein